MKYQSTVLSLILLLCVQPIPLIAQHHSDNQKGQIPIKKRPSKTSERPRMPAMITVDCWYGNGELSIEFRNPEGECDITVTDTTTGFTVTDTFDSALPYTIYIGTPQSAVITLTTEEGNNYYGEIN